MHERASGNEQGGDTPALARRAGGWVTGLVLAGCVVLGAFLRLRGIAMQVPLDDEWHGLDFALSRDAWFLFSHFSRAGANSVAYNVYLRAALASVGWTETTIVLPSLLAGVALLWFFPRWVRRRFGPEAAVVSAALLAIAPFLVGYSRTARVYSALLLCESLALAGLCQWLREPRRRELVVFVGCGALALWMHLTALPLMLAAVAAAAAHRAWSGRRGQAPPGPSVRQLVTAGLVMLAVAGAMWLPALLSPMPSPAHNPAHFSPSTLSGLVALLVGSASWPVVVVVALAALVGVACLARDARAETAIFVAALGSGLATVLLTRPNAAGFGGVLLRYLLPIFPFVSLAIGVAVQLAIRQTRTAAGRRVRWGLFAGLLAALYVAGPLPRIYGATNSFTKHPVLLLDFAVHDPDRARPDPLGEGARAGLHRSELQPFYAWLAGNGGAAPIIEYPYLLGRKFNLLYFAQAVHHRPVLAGYYHSGMQDADRFGLAMSPPPAVPAAHLSPGYVMDNMTLDHVLGRHPPDPRVRFRTLVDILDEASVRQSGAEYLVLHGNLLRELWGSGPERVRSFFVGRIRDGLVARYGAPVFENDLITVLRVAGRP